jgi:flavin reductase (DIM6/NTAB) family NADH-FMN oxidoreductase RutF
MGQFPSGVTIVTTRDARGRPFGLTVSAFCSISLKPPLILVSIDNRSQSHQGFKETGLFGVSILSARQQDLARRFATHGREKLADQPWVVGRLGIPLLPGAVAHLECRVVRSTPAGDHRLYLGEVLLLAVAPGKPLLYHAGGFAHVSLSAEKEANEPRELASQAGSHRDGREG